jgi:hypothetical protein
MSNKHIKTIFYTFSLLLQFEPWNELHLPLKPFLRNLGLHSFYELHFLHKSWPLQHSLVEGLFKFYLVGQLVLFLPFCSVFLTAKHKIKEVETMYLNT